MRRQGVGKANVEESLAGWILNASERSGEEAAQELTFGDHRHRPSVYPALKSTDRVSTERKAPKGGPKRTYHTVGMRKERTNDAVVRRRAFVRGRRDQQSCNGVG